MKKIGLKNQTELIVRKTRVTDAEQVLEHMRMVDRETKYLAREVGELTFTIEQEESLLKSQADRTDTITFVGIIEDKIMANCTVGLIRTKKRFLHRASMGLAIQKQYWGLGIGKILMLKTIDWCKEHSVEQLELEVVTSNSRAVALYKSLGFEVYGTTRHAFKYDDGSYADEYSMFLDLVKR